VTSGEKTAAGAAVAEARGARRAGRGGAPARGGVPGRVSPAASFLTVRELLGNPHLGVELFAGSQGLERSVRCPQIRKLTFSSAGLPGGHGQRCLASVSPAALLRFTRKDPALQRTLGRALSFLAPSRPPAFPTPPGPRKLSSAPRRMAVCRSS